MDPLLEELTMKIAKSDALFDALNGYMYKIQQFMTRDEKEG